MGSGAGAGTGAARAGVGAAALPAASADAAAMAAANVPVVPVCSSTCSAAAVPRLIVPDAAAPADPDISLMVNVYCLISGLKFGRLNAKKRGKNRSRRQRRLWFRKHTAPLPCGLVYV